MKKNDIVSIDGVRFRIFKVKGDEVLVINCERNVVPKWIGISEVQECIVESDFNLPSIEDLEPNQRKVAYERYGLIAPIIPFISESRERNYMISRISQEQGISKQTIKYYLWQYLVYQNITVLAPEARGKKPLTVDQKNIRWALNKFYYNSKKNTLKTAYTLMLNAKYCNALGELYETYPTFDQFKYFYRKHKKVANQIISREGLKSYQKDSRPLLGDMNEYLSGLGGACVALDATVCDIYLVDDEGQLIGRPILLAAVDMFSGMCCGYALTWEGGTYSLRSLILNVVADKVKHCRGFGIEIKNDDWNCKGLPLYFMTDRGKEYTSETFEQISDLGVQIINLPSYRADLKSKVEKFFDVVQNLYKPHLKGRGVIEPDFQERGAHDYRKDACVTLEEFEKILLYSIIHYNTQSVVENFPFTEDMLEAYVKPYRNAIWNYMLEQGGGLIPVTSEELVLTLLPRTPAKFTRKGLIANGIRYRHKEGNHTQRYLSGDAVIVAYNPEDVSQVLLLEDGNYIPFELIECRFACKTISEVEEMKAKQKELVKAEERDLLQSQIELALQIETVAGSKPTRKGETSIKGITENRQKERRKTHRNYVEEVKLND